MLQRSLKLHKRHGHEKITFKLSSQFVSVCSTGTWVAGVGVLRSGENGLLVSEAGRSRSHDGDEIVRLSNRRESTADLALPRGVRRVSP